MTIGADTSIAGMGIDLVEISRVERLISRDEDIFRRRILGATERLEIAPASGPQIRAHEYASCIAAKEAFLKALGTGLAAGMRWTDIEIVKRHSAAPMLAVVGEARRMLASLQIASIHLSLSLIKKQAWAMVVLTRNQVNKATTL